MTIIALENTTTFLACQNQVMRWTFRLIGRYRVNSFRRFKGRRLSNGFCWCRLFTLFAFSAFVYWHLPQLQSRLLRLLKDREKTNVRQKVSSKEVKPLQAKLPMAMVKNVGRSKLAFYRLSVSHQFPKPEKR
jgi:hypothetical protein